MRIIFVHIFVHFDSDPDTAGESRSADIQRSCLNCLAFCEANAHQLIFCIISWISLPFIYILLNLLLLIADNPANAKVQNIQILYVKCWS
ncbi:hypothetical protein ACF0H5_000080 [Mactra antiquata]